MLISAIPSTIISLWWIKKHYNATIDYYSSLKIILASLTSAAITYTLVIFFNLPNWITLILGAPVFLASYLITAPLIGAINQNDTKNLKEMLKVLGPLAPIFNIPLNIIERLATKLQKTIK
jgi:hypothetical protein